MAQPLTDAITALTRYANETTGQSDPDLSSAVRTLCDGFGGGGFSYDDIIERNITGDVIYEGTASLRDNLFYGTKITSFKGDSVPGVGGSAFANCSLLKSISLANMNINTTNTWGVFNRCTSLESVNLPKAKCFGQATFQYCTALKTVVLPEYTSVRPSEFDQSGLEKADFGKNLTSMYQGITKCYNLKSVILRRTTSITTMSSSLAFDNTPFKGYGGTYSGHVYVPQALISSYQSASNWSAMYANYPDLFQPIEGSEYEHYYADGTPIE